MESAIEMVDSKRQSKWEAGASHAEQGLRPTMGVFVIIDGPQGHKNSVAVAALKAAKRHC